MSSAVYGQSSAKFGDSMSIESSPTSPSGVGSGRISCTTTVGEYSQIDIFVIFRDVVERSPSRDFLFSIGEIN